MQRGRGPSGSDCLILGGLNKITFDSTGYRVDPVIVYPIRKRKLNSNLMLFFTGFARFSFDIQVSTRKCLKDKIQDLLEMKSLTEEAEKILVNPERDLNDFGRLLDYSWKLKRSLNKDISTEKLMRYMRRRKSRCARRQGAGGGRRRFYFVLCGAR